MKVGKALSFIAEQLSPPMTPGVGNAWKHIYDSMGEDPNAMTPAEALGGQVGYKVQPFDPQIQASKHQALLQSWHSEAMRQFKKEIAKHPTDLQKQEELRLKYVEVLGRIEQEMRGQ